MKGKSIETIWNQAVGEVGGNKNTVNNFKVIMKRFFELAKAEGYSFAYAKTEVMENLIATSEFMEW